MSSSKFDKAWLLNHQAYPHPVEEIQLRETHVSYVFLTGDFVYKIKKEIKFGDILDFSTLKRRKEFCQKEIDLNSRFSPEVYVKRVGVLANGTIVDDDAEDLVEYAVMMHQLPEEKLLNREILADNIGSVEMESIAKKLAEFHRLTKKVPEYGDPKEGGDLWEKWDENFRTTETFREESDEVKKKIFAFYTNGLLAKRVEENKIGDNHGDLQANNIFVISSDDIKIVDCIDFNPLLRFGDHAEDVGFLAMELDFLGKEDLSNYFVEKYIEYSKDTSLPEVLLFYKCYRAYVRGKVYGFQSVNAEDASVKQELWQLSEQYYQLAYRYLSEM